MACCFRKGTWECKVIEQQDCGRERNGMRFAENGGHSAMAPLNMIGTAPGLVTTPDENPYLHDPLLKGLPTLSEKHIWTWA